MGMACIMHGEMRNAYELLAGKPEEERSLGSHSRRWGNNIIIDRREIGPEGVDLIHPTEHRDLWQVLVNMVMNILVP
jgi:hypothetical protein